MDVSIQGKQLDVGDTLRDHVESNLKSNVKKYFNSALDCRVVLSHEGRTFQASIAVHAARGILMKSGGDAGDPYAAFDVALSRITKQLRRYKRKLNDHHKGRGADEHTAAQYSVIAAADENEEVPADAQPLIVAEMPTRIATLSAGEAVMRMDLADEPIMMFRNRAHGGLNVVYRRADGNIGWIDPSGADKPSNTDKQ